MNKEKENKEREVEEREVEYEKEDGDKEVEKEKEDGDKEAEEEMVEVEGAKGDDVDDTSTEYKPPSETTVPLDRDFDTYFVELLSLTSRPLGTRTRPAIIQAM